jgi:hypothetical protein
MRTGWPPLSDTDCVICYEATEGDTDMCTPCHEWWDAWRAMTPEQREAKIGGREYHADLGVIDK